MSIVIKKVFFAWQLKREQEWLENKAKEGLILKKVSPFRYVFDQEDPKDLVFQFDFNIISKKNLLEYLDMFQDWNHVAGAGGWQYFYKERKNDESDKIFNNIESKKAMFQRLIGFLLIIGFPIYYQLLVFFPNMDASELTFPKFYFFFRIVLLFITILYIYALINIILIYRTLSKSIRE